MRLVYIRRAIRILQAFPLVMSIVSVTVTLLFFAGFDVCQPLASIFGLSLFPLVCMYVISRSLPVSRWSRLLYVTLLVAMLFEALNSIFHFAISVYALEQTVLCILLAGIFSSLATYIYGKFKAQQKYKTQ